MLVVQDYDLFLGFPPECYVIVNVLSQLCEIRLFASEF